MKNVIIFTILFFTTITTIPAFAQESIALISVITDDKLYEEGDTIVISGDVTTRIVNETIQLQIVSPEENFIEIGQLNVAEDGSFTHTVIAEGPLWTKEGEYTVRVFYGGEIAEVLFDYELKSSVPVIKDIFEVDAGTSGTFDVKYTIKSGNLTSIAIDPQNYTLDVIIETNDEGSITLELPRNSIDAKTQDDSDEIFIVLIDGAEVNYEETKDSDSRTLTIEFIAGDSKIEIIGTEIVPEFGTIAALVLTISLISVIMLTRNKMKIRV